MFKKLLAMVLALCLCLSVTSCSVIVKSALSLMETESEDPWSEVIDFTSSGSEESSEEDETPTSSGESAEEENPTSSSEEESGGEETPVQEQDAKYLYFSDDAGYAYMWYTNGTFSGYAIMDTTGKAVYLFEEDEKCCVYANGYFISKADDVYYLKTVDGEVVTSSKELGVDGFGLCSNRTSYKKFLADGYVFAYKINEAYNGTTYEVGILGTDGNWIVPISKNHALIAGGMECGEEEFQEELVYANEGCLLASVDDVPGYSYDTAVYNIASNEMIYYSTAESVGNMDYMLTQIEFNEDGISRRLYGERMYEYHIDGTFNTYIITPDEINGSWGNHGFYVDENGETYTLGGDGWGLVLYTPDEIICDYQDDKNVDAVDAAYCGDGRWLMTIKSEAGGYYYTIIDYTGEFVFEPVKTAAQFVMLENGVGVATDNDYGSQDTGRKIIIDLDGEVLFESEATNTEISIQNGVVREAEEGVFGTNWENFTLLDE